MNWGNTREEPANKPTIFVKQFPLMVQIKNRRSGGVFSRNLEWGKGNHPQSQPHHHHHHGRSWRWHGHTTPSSTWITGGTTLSPSPPHQPPQGPPCSSPHQERLSSFQTLANPSSFPIPASASTTPIASLEKSMSSRSPAATMIPSSTSPPSAATPLPLGKSSLRSTLR